MKHFLTILVFIHYKLKPTTWRNWNSDWDSRLIIIVTRIPWFCFGWNLETNCINKHTVQWEKLHESALICWWEKVNNVFLIVEKEKFVDKITFESLINYCTFWLVVVRNNSSFKFSSWSSETDEEKLAKAFLRVVWWNCVDLVIKFVCIFIWLNNNRCFWFIVVFILKYYSIKFLVQNSLS